MSFNINEFIVKMGQDGARPNLFEITFANPGSVPSVPASENITLRAKASALPASTMGVASTFYFGRQAKFAGNRVFGDWTVTILMDEPDFLTGTRAFLESWSNALNGHVLNVRDSNFVFPQSYMMDGSITQYAKMGATPIARYRMVGCFPIDIGAIPVDWQANDTIMEFNVTFAMQWWERIEGGITDTGGVL